MQEFLYYRPETMDMAVQMLDMHRKDVKILAGGTDLIVALKDNTTACKCILDIKAIKELQDISFNEKNGLSIGSAVCLNDIIQSSDVINNYPILVESAKMLANSLLRNRATLAGNICNASPGGDMLPASIVMSGQAEIISKQGKRNVPLEEFFTGVKKTVLKENELVTRIVFPYVKGRGRYLKKSRIKGHDLAQVGVAAFLKEEGGLKLCIGAAGPTPIVVKGFETCNRNNIIDIKSEIINRAIEAVKPISDQRASKEYRVAMTAYLTGQILDDLGEDVL